MSLSLTFTRFQKSTGFAVYAMIQHYLWLVVFVWMVVEGVQMYLSLVQVFGSHISKYMLKFNLAAWGMSRSALTLYLRIILHMLLLPLYLFLISQLFI